MPVTSQLDPRNAIPPPPSSLASELKALVKHTSVYGAGNLLNKLAGFLLIPFYTHYLTPADYGTLELLDLSVALLGLAVLMWMNSSIVRYYYDYEDRRSRNEVISTALLIAFAVGTLCGTAGMLFAKQLSTLILKSPGYYRYFQLLSVTFFFSTLSSVSFSFLRAKQRSGLVTIVNVATLILSLCLNIYFIAIVHTGVIGILYSGLISTALAAVALTVVTVREVRLHFSPEKLKALATYGAPLVFTSFSAFALNFSDRFFLQHYTNVSTVGIYALGYKFGFMLSFLVVQPFDMIWSSRLYEVAKKQDGERLFSRIFRYYGLVLVSVALGLSLIIKDVISIVAAASFLDAYKVVPVVALAYVFQGAYRFMVGGIYLQKKTYRVGMISAVSLAANILLNFTLIPIYGAMGAAWATAISFLFMAGMAYVVSERLYTVGYQLGAFFVPVAVATGLYLIAAKISVASLALSAALKILLLACFPVALLLVGFFRKDEIRKAIETGQSLWTSYGWRSTAVSER